MFDSSPLACCLLKNELDPFEIHVCTILLWIYLLLQCTDCCSQILSLFPQLKGIKSITTLLRWIRQTSLWHITLASIFSAGSSQSFWTQVQCRLGLENNLLSNCLGEVDFPSDQVTFHSHLPNGQMIRHVMCQLNQWLKEQTTTCPGKATFNEKLQVYPKGKLISRFFNPVGSRFCFLLKESDK